MEIGACAEVLRSVRGHVSQVPKRLAASSFKLAWLYDCNNGNMQHHSAGPSPTPPDILPRTPNPSHLAIARRFRELLPAGWRERLLWHLLRSSCYQATPSCKCK